VIYYLAIPYADFKTVVSATGPVSVNPHWLSRVPLHPGDEIVFVCRDLRAIFSVRSVAADSCVIVPAITETSLFGYDPDDPLAACVSFA